MLKKKQLTQHILMICIGMISMMQTNAFSSPVKIKPPIAQAKSQHHQDLIVLIHGLMRTSLSMWPLKIYLQRQGYQVYSYSYPSAKYSIHEHAVYLNQFIKNLLAKNPNVTIHFITHSLGGIITREAVSRFSKKQLKHIGCLIMLAPPNQGSKLAKLSTKIVPMFTSSIKPLAELSSDQSAYVHRVPTPNIKIEIIAGRYDAKVPPDVARLQGQNDPIIVNSNHTFIMNNAKTKQLITNFLEKCTNSS